MVNGEKANYNAIDYFKLFCAFLVVGIHTEPFQFNFWLDSAFGILTRIAVPFFFVSSAFFFAKKAVTFKRCWQYCKRLLVLYILWSAVFITIEIIRANISIEDIPFIVFVRPYFHLWYLHASIVAAILYTILNSVLRGNRVLLLFIAGVIFVTGVLISTYSSITDSVPLIHMFANWGPIKIVGTKNGLFYGFPYFTVGAILSIAEVQNEERLSNKTLVLLIGIFFAALAAEGFAAVKLFHSTQTILWLSVLPLTVFVFIFVLRLELPSLRCALFCRKCSTIVYCIHPIIILVLDMYINNSIFLCLLTFGVSLAISALYYCIKEKFTRRKAA